MKIAVGCSKNFTYFVAFCISMISITSCQKEIKINLKSSPPALVVQGEIENGQPPLVLLTSSFGFFSTVDFTNLQDIFVHDAVVKVSDGMRTVQLREYVFDTTGSARFYVWSVDTANLANLMLGEMNKSYTLTIDYKGKVYSSTVKIPLPKGPDSLWLSRPNITGSNTPDNALELFCSYSDPDTSGNYVRYFTRRNNDAFYPGGLYSDEFVNGKYIASVDLFAGYNDSADAKIDSLIFFYPGDTITLKWCGVDKSVYDFWNTYQFSIQSGANPFATPINIRSNISNGALGVWSGYGSLYSTIIVK